jgi:GNAT superfamily N-acetyltransferase
VTAGLRAITELPVRRLTAADLPAIAALAADRGWPPEESKWRLMFAVSEPVGVDDPAGGLAGVVVLTRYGPGLAAIGMMLVAARHGRQGLGRRLMEYALGRAGGAVVYLSATDFGRPLYERLGFRTVDRSVTYSGRLAADEPVSARGPDPTADVRPILAMDREVFGADRGRVLAELTTFADRFEVLGDPVAGYAAGWNKDGTRVIGPLVATDTAAAARLIGTVAAGWPGPVRLDLLGRHSDLADWATAHGLAAGEETALMVLGGGLPGDRARLYCPVTVAIG